MQISEHNVIVDKFDIVANRSNKTSKRLINNTFLL